VTRRGDEKGGDENQAMKDRRPPVRHLLYVTSFRHLFAALLLTLSCVSQAAELFSLNTGDLRAELADARKAGKQGVMLFFEQEGCPGCAHMKANVFPRKDVQDYYTQHFVSLSVDIFSSVPLRDFANRDGTEKTFSQNLKIRATPTFIFYDLSGAELVRIVGPTQTPEEFLLLGRFVTSGAYRTRTFAQYKLENPLRKGS
jgi:thioredoxin-related protein